jgi:hypothetical protein
MDRTHDIHSAHHAPEHRETLAVRIARSAEIECRLIADTDEELGRRRSRPGTCHRNRTVDMQQPGIGRCLVRNGRERAFPVADTTLDDRNHRAAVIVRGRNDAIEHAVVEMFAID